MRLIKSAPADETTEERTNRLGAWIWNTHFATETKRRDGLEVWRRVAEQIRRGLQETGDAGPVGDSGGRG